jgi:hypothetical protein
LDDASVVVPTHRDHPWERDARVGARENHSLEPDGAGTRWWAWAALLVIAGHVVVTAVVPAQRPPRSADTPRPSGSVAAPVAPFRVLALRSRLVGERRVRVWGTANAPGATVRVHVRVAGQRAAISRRVLVDADGLFEAFVLVPRLVGRGARVQAELVP